MEELFAAAEEGNKKLLAEGLKQDDFLLWRNDDGWSVLAVAAYKGYIDCVRAIIEECVSSFTCS